MPERTREPALDRNVRGVHFLAAGLAGGEGGYRAQSGSKAGGRVCRLRVRLPDEHWLARFGLYHPLVVVELLSVLDLESELSLSEVRMHTPGLGPWAEEVGLMDRVREVEVLWTGPAEVHLRVTHPTVGLLRILKETRLTVRYPIMAVKGDAWLVVAGPVSKIHLLIQKLRERVGPVALEAVRHRVGGSAQLLTPRQRELLVHAVAAGYFEVPRKVSLTQLAAQERMAVSSLSQALAVAERKIVTAWPFGEEPGALHRRSATRIPTPGDPAVTS